MPTPAISTTLIENYLGYENFTKNLDEPTCVADILKDILSSIGSIENLIALANNIKQTHQEYDPNTWRIVCTALDRIRPDWFVNATQTTIDVLDLIIEINNEQQARLLFEKAIKNKYCLQKEISNQDIAKKIATDKTDKVYNQLIGELLQPYVAWNPYNFPSFYVQLKNFFSNNIEQLDAICTGIFSLPTMHSMRNHPAIRNLNTTRFIDQARIEVIEKALAESAKIPDAASPDLKTMIQKASPKDRRIIYHELLEQLIDTKSEQISRGSTDHNTTIIKTLYSTLRINAQIFFTTSNPQKDYQAFLTQSEKALTTAQKSLHYETKTDIVLDIIRKIAQFFSIITLLPAIALYATDSWEMHQFDNKNDREIHRFKQTLAAMKPAEDPDPLEQPHTP